MKNKLLIAIILLLLSLHTLKVCAHPISNTNTTIIINSQDSRQADVEFLFNWIQVFSVINESGFGEVNSSEDLISFLTNNYDEIEKYTLDNFEFLNNSRSCELSLNKNLTIEKTANNPFDLLIVGNLTCENKISRADLYIDFFHNNKATQNNIFIRNEQSDEDIITGILTTDNNKFTFDYLEISSKSVLKNMRSDDELSNKLLKTFNYVINDHSYKSLIMISIVSLLVGALHALEGGHSKLILTSFMIKKKASLKDGLKFTTIFTLTHMSDLIIVAILLTALDFTKGLYNIAGQIQIFAIYSMVLISSWQLLREVSHLLRHKFAHKFKKSHHHEHHHHHHGAHSLEIERASTKEAYLLAFLEGLAPCLTGWTILLMVISTGRIALLFHVILSFAYGIFMVLLIIMVLVYKFKVKINEKITWFSEYSALISSALLLLSTLYLAHLYL